MKEEIEIRLRCLELAHKEARHGQYKTLTSNHGVDLDEVFSRSDEMIQFVYSEDGKEKELMRRTIEDCCFTCRTHNCLLSEKILTLGDLINCTEQRLGKIRNLGRKSIGEIKWYLRDIGFKLKDDVINE